MYRNRKVYASREDFLAYIQYEISKEPSVVVASSADMPFLARGRDVYVASSELDFTNFHGELMQRASADVVLMSADKRTFLSMLPSSFGRQDDFYWRMTSELVLDNIYDCAMYDVAAGFSSSASVAFSSVADAVLKTGHIRSAGAGDRSGSTTPVQETMAAEFFSRYPKRFTENIYSSIVRNSPQTVLCLCSMIHVAASVVKSFADGENTPYSLKLAEDSLDDFAGRNVFIVLDEICGASEELAESAASLAATAFAVALIGRRPTIATGGGRVASVAESDGDASSEHRSARNERTEEAVGNRKVVWTNPSGSASKMRVSVVSPGEMRDVDSADSYLFLRGRHAEFDVLVEKSAAKMLRSLDVETPENLEMFEGLLYENGRWFLETEMRPPMFFDLVQEGNRKSTPEKRLSAYREIVEREKKAASRRKTSSDGKMKDSVGAEKMDSTSGGVVGALPTENKERAKLGGASVDTDKFEITEEDIALYNDFFNLEDDIFSEPLMEEQKDEKDGDSHVDENSGEASAPGDASESSRDGER